jgi:hypothetical protein
MAAGQRRKRWFLIGLTVAVGFPALGISYALFSWAGAGILGIGVLIAVRLFLDYIDGLDKKAAKKEKRAIRGAQAEEKIGAILEELGESYLVLHDVRSQYGNIDHIVISQHGIYLIETKAHGGRITITGDQLLLNAHAPENNFISQTLSNTYWLREQISRTTNTEAWITPILVFTNAYVETGTIKGIKIVNKKFLLPILKNGQPTPELWHHRTTIAQSLR